MDQVKLARKQPFFTLKLKNKNEKYLKKKKTRKISKRETHWQMAGETADRNTN